ncbi:MAG: 30S ribosomal protein S8 [Candidatus Eiseniibacteriota bacterium]
MSVSDPIADLLTCIRNACKAKHKKVDVPTSKSKAEVVRVLLREKYINNYKSIDDKKRGILRIYLKYDQKERPVIQGIERVSKPGRRVYIRRHQIPKVQGGLGTALISTPSGLMTDIEAREEGLGGEYLCKIW